MKLDRWLEAAAAPLGSLFVLLVLVLAAAHRPEEPVGVWMEVPQISSVQHEHLLHPDRVCEVNEDRTIYIQIDQQNHGMINEDQIEDGQLTARLKPIFANRPQNYARMIADPRLPYGDFLERYRQITASADNLQLSVVTDTLLRVSAGWSWDSIPVLLFRGDHGVPVCRPFPAIPRPAEFNRLDINK